MHNDPEMFKNLMGEIDAIEINRQLDNDGLKRAICNVFLSHGPRLLLVTTRDNKAWLYFKNDKLIAAYTKDKSNLDALEELIEWTDVHVNEYRNVDCKEQHFKLDVQYFQVFCQKDELGDHDYYNALYKIRQLRYITGFMIFKKLEIYLDELAEKLKEKERALKQFERALKEKERAPEQIELLILKLLPVPSLHRQP